MAHNGDTGGRVSVPAPVAGLEESAPAGDGDLVHILLVDDNPAKRLALKAALRPLGHTIVEAGSAPDALRQVLVHDFAVILMDVQMPITDGFETAALIRQRRESEMTPIIFVTAYGKDELRNDDLYAQGAVDFIAAPVSTHELQAKVTVFANLFKRARSLAARSREVRAYADQLRLLTDAAPIGIFQTDAAGRYMQTNPRWSEISGISAREAEGQDWETLIASEGRSATVSKLPDGRLDRAAPCTRFEIRSADSPPRTVLVTSRPVIDGGGEVSGFVGTLADVTAEAEAEAVMSAARDTATEASRLKSDFLANMSHEIRTPMNGVIGMTELLLETDLDARQRDYAETVRSSGQALMAIIDDILDFSKLEAGKLEIEEIIVEPQAILDDVVDLLAPLAQAKGLELVAVVEDSVPPVVRGDPGRVRQVLTNLIGNAIKFTQSGEVVIRVSAVLDRSDPVIRFEVSDTGSGIAADKLALVFDPFVQEDSSTSRRYGGTGLGLAISNQLVGLMGGSCGVSSRPGEGSCFWFTIRVQREPGEVSAAEHAPDARLGGVGVLLVDDNATQRGVLAGYLSDWGMSVTTADSGETALEAMRSERARARRFEVVVLDQSMPGMDGLQVTAAIDADPGLATSIVLMTELGGEPPLERGGSEIRTSFSKPVHRDDLLACLHVALGLPAPGSKASAPAARPRPASGEAATGRLLLAEDNPTNQRVATAMLAGAGYEVDTVADGRAAVRAAATEVYDTILMDCQMPELNGYEATAAIRAQEGRDRHIPIIAMTAGVLTDDRERCLAAGMDAYIAKPVGKEVLLALVATSVNGGTAVPHAAGPAESGERPPAERLEGEPPPRTATRRPRDEPLPAGAPVLNAEIIERLERLGDASGEDLMAELTVLFLTDADTQVVGLRRALVERDGEAVGRLAHALRGASANLGATGLVRLCAAMETTSAAGDLGGGELLLESVEAELDRVRDALLSRAAPS